MKEYTLGQITKSISDGKHGGCQEHSGSGFYFISVKDLADYEIDYSKAKQISKEDFDETITRAFIEAGDTVYANTGDTIGKCVYIQENEYNNRTTFQKSVAILKANKDLVVPRFLFYLLKNETRGLREAATGSAQKNLLLSSMRSYKVKIPDIREQMIISGILESIDKIISNNNSINQNLLQQALCIYSALIDGKVKNGCIGDYCSIKSGFAFKSKWWQASGIPVVKIGSISQDSLNLLDCSYVSEDKVELAKDYIVYGGDLLIAMTGATIGKFTMVPKTDRTILVNQRVGKFFLGKDPVRKLPFIYCTLKQPDVYSEVINRGQGSAQPNISASDIVSIPCVIPQPEEISRFNENASPIFEMIINNQLENSKLAKTRDTLLPQLMSGELDVSEIEL